MMEQVEADVTLLMAGKVPPVFKGLATATATIAYLGFKGDLLGLPLKASLECTFAESVQVTCLSISLPFSLRLFAVFDLVHLVSFFQDAF